MPENSPANVPKNHQNSNIFRRKNSGKCSKKAPKRSRGLRRARYETRVGSPPDFQPKRVSAPSCFRARFAALRQFVAQTPEISPQMFHKNAKTTTNAGEFPGKCSTKAIIPLHRCTENNEISPKSDSDFTSM